MLELGSWWHSVLQTPALVTSSDSLGCQGFIIITIIISFFAYNESLKTE